MLAPGETKQATLPLPDENLMMFDEFDQEWKLFKGTYKIMAGSSSRDIRLVLDFIIE
jgi:uncharacterized protein YjaG (DUF416 family)